MDIYLKSSADAVALCWELAATGRADLFRGQTRHWPKLLPSLLRRAGRERVLADRQLAAFLDWAERAPQMAPYDGHRGALTAIAQHYGIPTRLLDLSTDPTIAALFAKTAGEVPDGATGVIYGFLERDLTHVDRCAIVRIAVGNLWRLEAQRGLFLHVGAERTMAKVLARAVRIHFPLERIADHERLLLYPARKSALESVIDQWLYRHQMDEVTSLFEPIEHRLAIKRETYPGAFRWRKAPPLDAGWIGSEARWVYPRLESVSVAATVRTITIVGVDPAGPIAEAIEHVRAQIAPSIRRHRIGTDLLNFAVDLPEWEEREIAVATLINRCWDGLRVLPYPLDELVDAMALAVALLWRRAVEAGEIDPWLEELWGTLQLIDVAPIGGHIETAAVCSRDLDRALSSRAHDGLTGWMRRSVVADARAVMDYVVDPWLLFDFAPWRRVFVTQFVPAALVGYYESDLEDGDGALTNMWSVPFNAALLGYITLAEFRFRSPIGGERDVNRIVFVAPDMDYDDLEEAFSGCLPTVHGGGEPFQVRFSGYGMDEREVWQIDRVVEQCRWIVDIGGISVLDVFPSVRDLDGERPKPSFATNGLGAFDVWLIARGLVAGLRGKPLNEHREVIAEFMSELGAANTRIDARAASMPGWPAP